MWGIGDLRRELRELRGENAEQHAHTKEALVRVESKLDEHLAAHEILSRVEERMRAAEEEALRNRDRWLDYAFKVLGLLAALGAGGAILKLLEGWRP